MTLLIIEKKRKGLWNKQENRQLIRFLYKLEWDCGTNRKIDNLLDFLYKLER